MGKLMNELKLLKANEHKTTERNSQLKQTICSLRAELSRALQDRKVLEKVREQRKLIMGSTVMISTDMIPGKVKFATS